jgi:phosphatidyl-myo-inositol dimannoside synthase
VKVLVLTSSYPVSDGSYEGRFIADLSRRMLMQGIDPVVLSPHFPGGRFKETQEGILLYRFPYFFPFRFERLAYGAGLLINIRRDFFAFAGIISFCKAEFFWTLAILFREQVDIIHTHWLIPQGLIGALVQWLTGIPHVATVHGSDLAVLKGHALLRPLGRFIVRHSTIITVNSTYAEKQLLEMVPESLHKIRIIPMGIDPSAFMSGTGPETGTKRPARRIILSVGRLIELKGVRFLIESLPAVLRAVPDTDLVIIGSGPDQERLARRVYELSLDDHVQFMGTVRHDELAPYYQAADVFVLPSIAINGTAEGLGVVLLEAMASGCPVIGSSVGGIPDIITDEENGFLVPERDPAMLADRIIRILANPELSRKFRKNGLLTVRETFAGNRISARFADVYMQVQRTKTNGRETVP